ncbi:MAG: biopolymer transporter ExbD [Flavobacteriaceae bacterium]
MKRSKILPEIHAGSMADIAFLLLIFFLVSTTLPNEQGIVRTLPPNCETGDCSAHIIEQNIFRIQLNKQDELMVNGELIPIRELPKRLTEFIDNNGDRTCNYCQGASLETGSQNPTKAIVSLTTARESSYKEYIAVQGIISMVYLELREQYIRKVYRKKFDELSEEEMTRVRKAYPLLLSEASVQ